MSGIEKREVLESWKEISSYLNRDVKTCRRWEQGLDLPIRRLDDTPRARVFAYKDEIDYWLKAKLNNREISTTKYLRLVKKKSKKLWIFLSAAFAVIITAIAIRFVPRIDFVSPRPEKPHLAVLPIQNFTGDESLTHLQDALTYSIVNDLYQSKYIRVLTAERMNNILKDMNKLDGDSYTLEDLKKIVSLDGATHFLSGFVTKSGEKIRLNLSLQEAGSWKTLWADQMDGTENDMFDMVDELTKTLKSQFNLTEEQIADDFDKAVAEITTPNARALQFYIQAQRAMNDTEWNLAIEHFERATALDPDFAMAYRFLSGVYNHLALTTGNQNYWEKLHEAGKKSLAAAKRRPPSERERLIIEGAYIEKSSDEYPAIAAQEMEIFKKLLELYPDDDYGNLRLGTRYVQGGNYDRAEKHLKQIVSFSNNAFTFFHLSKIYMDQERYAEADDLLELGMERFPNNFLIFQRMASLHALQHEFDEALFWCDRGFEVEPIQFRDSLVRGDVLFFMGDFSAAETEFRGSLSSKNNKTRLEAALSLLQLYDTQGRFKDATLQAQTAKQNIEKDRPWDFDPINTEMTRVYVRNGNIHEALKVWDEVMDIPTRFKLQGEIYVSTQQWPEAEEVLDQIEDLIQQRKNEGWGLYLAQNDMEGLFLPRLRNALSSLKARIALEKGDYEQAIVYMEEAKTFYPGLNLIPADLIDILGRAFYKSGDLESARDQFEWISRMTYNRKEFGDVYARSFYMLGRIFEELGEKRKALDLYEKFLDLWENADPGIPEIEDSRARLNIRP